MSDSKGSRSSGGSVRRTLSITIPEDSNAEHNPDYKSPPAAGQEMFDDSESDVMVLLPSDSVSNVGGNTDQMVMMHSDSQSSMASEMIRIDSQAGLS